MKHLQVSIADQQVILFENGDPLLRFPVSTSRFGLGSEEGSLCTPLGDFLVCEKYGSRAPRGTIFKGRQPIGLWNQRKETDEDLVLTRILRLEDQCCETTHTTSGTTTNTYRRYIYFHGTNQEELIGSPSSHGCIRLLNLDMIELFNQVPVGTPVTISPSSTLL